MALRPPRFSPLRAQRVPAASSALVFLLVTILLARGDSAAAQAPPSLVVEKARVYWQPAGAATPEQIAVGLSQKVAPGDTIVTDGLGRAALQLGTDARVTIYPNSRVQINDLAPQNVGLSLLKGTIYLDTPPKGIPLTVALPDTSVKAAGRVFVYYNERDKSTWVVVRQGNAEVTGAGSSVVLGSRQQTWATGGGAPVQAQPANRKMVGARFYMIDDLTNRALHESDVLAPEFPWLPAALAAVAVALVGGALALRRRMVKAGVPAEEAAAPAWREVPPAPVPAPTEIRPAIAAPPKGQALPRPAELSIGRAPDNRLVLDDIRVSAHHARILASDGGYLIEDLDSTNGTYVNDARVTRAPLRDGDKVRFGGQQFVFGAAGMVLHPIAVAAAGEARQPRAPSAWLDVFEANTPGRRSGITRERFTIGRHPDNDLVLQSPIVSRHHAAISRLAGGWAIEDLKSTSGVLVDGTQVLHAPLANGTQIQLGDVRLVFHVQPQIEEEVAP